MAGRSKAVAAAHPGVGDPLIWIEAAPFRAHVAHVMAAGSLSHESVAAIAGVTPKVIARLLQDEPGQPVRLIRADLGRRLLEIRGSNLSPRLRVSSGRPDL